MKKKLVVTSALCSMLLLGACSGGSKGSAVSAADSVAVESIEQHSQHEVDSSASYVQWKGFKPGGEHFGKLPVSTGTVAISEGMLYGGHVELAMNGIIVEDLEGEMAQTLKAHLENEDFFEAATYPVARFELTDIPAEGVSLNNLTELKGNLTLKDVTKNITIPVQSAVLDAESGVYVVESQSFRINRVDWNVKYGSKSLFTGLGDKFIDDEIELRFVLKTK